MATVYRNRLLEFPNPADTDARDGEFLLRQYLGLLEIIARYSPRVEPPELTQRHVERLIQLREEVATGPNPQLLERNTSAVGEELERYQRLIESQRATLEAQIHEILRIFGESAVQFADRSKDRVTTLSSISKDLAAVAESPQSSPVRVQLIGVLSRLRTLTEEMERQEEQSLTDMRKRLEQFERKLEEVEQVALTDPLTGLLNRRGLEKRVQEAKLRPRPRAVLLIDADAFKIVNDVHGHDAGDEVLKGIARRLSHIVRSEDAVCRWGGDEFVLLMECPLSVVRQRKNSLLGKLRIRYEVTVHGVQQSIECGASVGLAEWQPGEPFEEALRRADLVLYEAKRERA